MKVRNEMEARTCHDLRHWTTCDKCGGIGDGRAMLKVGSELWHGGCVVDHIDAPKVMRLPDAELGKLRLNDMGPALARRILTKIAKHTG